MPLLSSLRRTLAAGLVLAGMLAASACGSRPPATTGAGGDGASEATPVRVAVLVGSQYFPIKVLLDRHFDEAHGIRVEVTRVANPTAITTALESGAVDIAFHGMNEVLNNRANGGDWRAIAPMTGFEAEDVVVPVDSPIRDWADLRGRTIGSFGGPESAAGALLRLDLKTFFGFDPMDHMLSAAAPLVVGMLEEGKVDAAYLNDPYVSKLVATGRYRSLGNVGALWKSRTGERPLLVATVTTDEYLKAHAEAAEAFLAAFRDARRYLDDHPELWGDLAATVEVDDPAAVSLLRTRLAGSYLDAWTDELLAAQKRYDAALVETLGPGIVPETFPEDAVGFGSSR